jgi:hypothetical protein
MNYLHKNLVFETIEEGEKQLQEAISVRNKMCGDLYYRILDDDCNEIRNKLLSLKASYYRETGLFKD